jgi:hypothetical protein
MRDGATGRSRGFGFLTFKDPKTVNIVMVKEHFLDGKIVSVAEGRAVAFRRKSDLLRRSIQNEQYPVMNKRRPVRSS